jgi:hypothetical protein
VLEECKPIKETLLEREQHYLDRWKPEYNILPKAGSRLGSTSPHSSETIEKIHVAHQSDHVRQAHSDYQTAKMADPANRQRISDKMKQYRSVVTHQGSNVFGTKRSEDFKRKLSESLRASEKKREAYKRQKGRTIPNVSISGHYAIVRREERNKWCVRIEGKYYGEYDSIEEAIDRRDVILTMKPEDRVTISGGRLPSSGHRNIIWSKDRWIVRIGTKQYGCFDTIEEAVARRDVILATVND